MTDRLSTPKLVAYLKERGIPISPNTLRKLAHKREIVYTPFNGVFYFHMDSVEAYFDRLAVPAKRQFLSHSINP